MTAADQSFKLQDGSHHIRKVGVLLIHGLAGSPAEVRYVANGLARSGYSVSCPMLAGHGGTEADLEATTWADWLASCETALARLRRDCDTVVAGGLSTGAILALMLAAKHPSLVQATALYSPTLWLSGWAIPHYAKLFSIIRTKRLARLFRFSDRAPHGIKDDRVRDVIMKAMRAADGTQSGLLNTPGIAMLEHRRLVAAVKPLLGLITQPALVLHPRDDDMAGLDNAYFLQRRLKGRVEMTVLDDSYHMITIDRQRQIVVDRTEAFIAGLTGAAAAAQAKVELQARTRAAASSSQGAATAPGKVAVAA